MNNLFAFGCSHTFGYGLRDVIPYMDYYEDWDKSTDFEDNYTFASKLAWPQILANKLKLKCHNYGYCGASSKEVVRIFTQCLQRNKILTNDTVTILWPAFLRTGIFHKSKTLNCRSERLWPSAKDKKSAEFFFHYYDEYDFAIQRWQEIILVDLLCKDRGINCYHTLVNEELHPKEVELDQITKNMNIDYIPIESPRLSSNWIVDKARDGMHYGVESHKLIANKWHTFITSINNIVLE